MSLERLLRPRSIAVFGGREAANLVHQCDRMGFAGDIWPVHPYRDELAGRRCFRSTAELPRAPDAAFIGVNRTASVDIVAQLARRGAGGAVVYASGFAETADSEAAGEGLQERLVAAAGAMPVLGPNCYGFVNYLDGAPLWPDQHGGVRVARGVAIVTQSSNLTINVTMQQRGLPIAYAATLGNQAQTDLAAIARDLLADDRVTAIGLHIEGIKNARGFEAMAALARAHKVPVVALKPGHSEQARATTLSHTASIAGSDTAADAFLRRLGIARVQSLPEFLEALKLLHVHGGLPGNAIGSMSCSGGDAALVADAAQTHGVHLPALSKDQGARIGATLDAIVTITNPLDYHTFIWGQRAPLAATFRAVAACDFDLLLLVLDFPRLDRCDDADWNASADALEAVVADTGARTALVATLPDNLPEARAHELIERDIAPLSGIDEAMAAVQAAAFIGGAQRAAEPAPVLLSAPPVGPRCLVHEVEAKRWLAAYGLTIPKGQLATDADSAVAAAECVGYPVAVKVTGTAHKTDAGGVRLGLRDGDAVRAAAHALLGPGQSLLVEHMVEDAVAELVVGVTRDPQFGLLMTIGAGGVLVEILGDSASLLLLPATRGQLQAALASLRIAPLLRGYRSRPAADMEAALDALAAVARFAEANAGRLLELDVNPLLVGPAGQSATAADALIVIKEDTT
jgi:acyl-CoA synthetase (NDP forming)